MKANTTIDMTQVIAKAAELNNDIVALNRELKRVASIKCRLKKAPGRLDYQANMTACLQEEQLLKNVRDYLVGPRKTVNELTADDIADMSYDEVCKAIRSIQSKKTHTKWAEDCLKDEEGLFIPGSGAMYQEACRIEGLLAARRAELKPATEGMISVVALRDLLDTLKLCSDIDAATCINRIEEFLEGGEDDA